MGETPIDFPVGSRVLVQTSGLRGLGAWTVGEVIQILTAAQFNATEKALGQVFTVDSEVAVVQPDGSDLPWYAWPEDLRPLDLPDRSSLQEVEAWLQR